MGWLSNYVKKYSTSRDTYSRDVFDEDDPFWEQYHQLSDRYKSQVDPYLYYNYTPGYKDFLRGMLGMKTNEDAVRNSAQAQAWKALGSISQDVFQNDWNSASEQVAREQDAGLNPDLSGEPQGEPASGAEQPMTPPVVDFLTPPSSFAMDLVDLFGKASQVVGSASQFGSMLGSLAKVGAEIPVQQATKNLIDVQTAGAEVSTLKGAKEVVDDYLAGLHPDSWKTYMVDGSIDSGVVKQDFDKFFGDVPEASKKYLDAALNRSLSDPRVMQKYYDAANKVVPAVGQNIALNREYGNGVDFLSTFIDKQNNDIIRWTQQALRRQSRYQSELLRLNQIQNDNAVALEEFRRDNKLPEAQSKAELAQFLAQQAEGEMAQLRINEEKDWLNRMQQLRRSDDPAVRDAANYLIQAYFANQAPALIQSAGNGGGSVNIGDFGVSGNGGRSHTTPLHLPW